MFSGGLQSSVGSVGTVVLLQIPRLGPQWFLVVSLPKVPSKVFLARPGSHCEAATASIAPPR